MTLIDYTQQLLGNAPNDVVLTLYYLLDIFLVIYFLKVLLMMFRSIFNINRKGGF